MSAFETVKQKRVNGILTIANRRFFVERKRIVKLAGKYRLPTVYPQRDYVDEFSRLVRWINRTSEFEPQRPCHDEVPYSGICRIAKTPTSAKCLCAVSDHARLPQLRENNLVTLRMRFSEPRLTCAQRSIPIDDRFELLNDRLAEYPL